MKKMMAPFVAAAAMFLAQAVGAQTYPSKPLRLVVPYPAGGGTDVMARTVGQKLSERLGQPVVVENRTGASGNIGTDFVIKAQPDGYTLLFNNETLVVAPSVSKNVPYDVLRDLVPVGMVAESFIVVGVHTSVNATSLRELVAMAKAQPGKLSYSSCGNGTIMHLAGELLKQSAEIDITHVPYRGCAPAMQDSASGQVPVFFNALTNVQKLEKAGRVRMLAVASSKRSALDPAIPTVAESGFPGYAAAPFQAVFAPAGTPPEIVTRLSNELKEAVNAADVSERIRGMLFEPRYLPPAELTAMLRTELARWARVAKTARIEAE
jgi:tripartite-type tricarboxylate transporter receptor subunit TctC